MADTLRSLVVSLSLDSDQFTRNMRSINLQIKEAESAFRLAGAGVEGFEKTIAGTRAKVEMLDAKLHNQISAVDQYQRAWHTANRRLDESVDRQARLENQLNEARGDLQVYAERLRLATAEYQAFAGAMGEADASTQISRQSMEAAQREYQEAQQRVAALTRELDAARRSTQANADTLTRAQTNLNNAKAAVAETSRELEVLRSKWTLAAVASDEFAAKCEKVGKPLTAMGKKMTLGLTAPIAILGKEALESSVNFEKAFAGVRKTVDATEDEYARFSQSIIEMSQRMATSAVDIAQVMEIAGQLGIKNESLEQFTETIVKLGSSTNMSMESAAEQMAKFANIVGGLTGEQYAQMGSTIVDLGNSYATTESEIMEMAMRIAASGKQVGLTTPQILGFATALSSMGLEAQAGGSSFSKALRKMEISVATGDESLTDFARISGMTAKEFSAAWESDPAEAFSAFIVGLSKMDEAGISTIKTLDDIGITELRLTDTLLRTVNATELVANAQRQANAAWGENTAMDTEFERFMNTAAAQMENLKNSAKALAIQFGDIMLPVLKNIIATFDGWTKALQGMDESTKETVVRVLSFVATVGPVTLGVGKIITAVGKGAKTFSEFAKFMAKFTASTAGAGKAATGIAKVLGTGGPVLMAIAGGVAALVGLNALIEKVNAARIRTTLNADELKQYKINADELNQEVSFTIDTKAKIAGDITSLNDLILQTLTDGKQETEADKEKIQKTANDAIAPAFEAIENAYKEKQAELETLYKSGLIDEETYKTESETLTAQTDQMRSTLNTKAEAVTEYVLAMCNANRKPTEEEIQKLNDLTAALNEAAAAAVEASDSKMMAYEAAYSRTLLGVGDETDIQVAAEYIEYLTKAKLANIEADKKAAEALRDRNTVAANGDAQQIAKIDEEYAQTLSQIRSREAEVMQARQGMYGQMVNGLLSADDLKLMQDYVTTWVMYAGFEKGINEDYAALQARDGDWGSGGKEGLKAFEDAKKAINDIDTDKLQQIKNIMGYMYANEESKNGDALSTRSGMFGAIIEAAATIPTDMETAGTNAVQGFVDGENSKSEDVKSAAQSVVDDTVTTIENGFDEHSPSRVMYQHGLNVMRGFVNGVNAGRSMLVAAMQSAARAAVQAAKDTLQIHSPSRVFADEVGTMVMKGFGQGVIKETEAQAEVLRNASRYLTGEAKAGAIAYNQSDNRRTYTTSSEINITGNQFTVRDQQDIHDIAVEIAALTRATQRSKGVRMA